VQWGILERQVRLMKCPKCGFVQPQTEECLSCGLIIERYRSQDEIRQLKEEVQQASEPEEEDAFGRPIRSSMRVVRTGAGVIGVAVGAWLFVAGQQIELHPLHVLLLIAYGCVSLFWILSAPLPTPIRQFAIEMLIFVAATLTLRIALPEAFELGRLSNTQRTPLGAGAHMGGTGSQKSTTPAQFAGFTASLAESAREVLDDPTDVERTEGWFEEFQATRRRFRYMAADQRKLCEGLYKSLLILERRMEDATKRSAGMDSLERAFIAIEDLERAAIGFP